MPAPRHPDVAPAAVRDVVVHEALVRGRYVPALVTSAIGSRRVERRARREVAAGAALTLQT